MTMKKCLVTLIQFWGSINNLRESKGCITAL